MARTIDTYVSRIIADGKRVNVLVSSVPITTPVTAGEVRAEAQRRMLLLLGARDPEHLAVLISNGLREQGRLQAARMGVPGVVAARDLTPEETERAQVLWAADVAIEAIRAASNAMESDPPSDFDDDARWPALK